MADQITIPATDLRAGDRCPDHQGRLAYTVQEVRVATRKTGDAPKGAIVALVQWMDGGLSERWWAATDTVHLIGRAEA